MYNKLIIRNNDICMYPVWMAVLNLNFVVNPIDPIDPIITSDHRIIGSCFKSDRSDRSDNFYITYSDHRITSDRLRVGFLKVSIRWRSDAIRIRSIGSSIRTNTTHKPLVFILRKKFQSIHFKQSTHNTNTTQAQR